MINKKIFLASVLLNIACQKQDSNELQELETTDSGFVDSGHLDTGEIGQTAEDCLNSIVNILEPNTAGLLIYSPNSLETSPSTFESQVGPNDIHHDLRLIAHKDAEAKIVDFQWDTGDGANMIVINEWPHLKTPEDSPAYLIGAFHDCQTAAAWIECERIPTENGNLNGCTPINSTELEINL